MGHECYVQTAIPVKSKSNCELKISERGQARAMNCSITHGLLALRAWIAVAMLATAATGVRADDAGLKQDAKQVGHEVGTAVREAGQEAKKVGKAVKKAAKEGVQAVKEGGKEFKRAVKGDGAEAARHD
jgi:hypothetical protein